MVTKTKNTLSQHTRQEFMAALEEAGITEEDVRAVILSNQNGSGTALMVVAFIRNGIIKEHTAMLEGLTERQLKILRLIARGLPSKAIASELAISEATLKLDMRAIFNHLGAKDRAHAVAIAIRAGLDLL